MTDKLHLSYMNAQMIRVAPLPVMNGDNGQFRLLLCSEKGKTNYLSITNEQFRVIEKYLCGIPLAEIAKDHA